MARSPITQAAGLGIEDSLITENSSLLPADLVTILEDPRPSPKPKEKIASVADSNSDPISSTGLDSGYGSQTSSQTSSQMSTPVSEGSAEVIEPYDKSRGTLWGILFRKNRTQFFNKSIPIPAQNRLADISELISKPLGEFLIQAKVDPTASRNIAMKLKWCGQDEANAKLHIVLMCNAAAAKKVSEFFLQDWVVAQCRPPESDSSFPSLMVSIWPRPPKKLAKLAHVFGAPVEFAREASALLGTSLKIVRAEITRFGTLGGVILVCLSGVSHLYGMTAGHIVSQQPALEDDFSIDDDRDGELGIIESNIGPSSLVKGLGKIMMERGSTSWSEVRVVSTSFEADDVPTHRNLDWMLVSIDSLLADTFAEKEASAVSQGFPLKPPKIDRRAFIYSSDGQRRNGTVSASMSAIILAPGVEFVITYDFVLNGEDVLSEGDSGAWVIDDQTLAVFGHVVASDDFGEGYVVPFNDTLEDIAKYTGADSVRIPTQLELSEWYLGARLADPIASLALSQPAPQKSSSSHKTPTVSLESIKRSAGKVVGWFRKGDPPQYTKSDGQITPVRSVSMDPHTPTIQETSDPAAKGQYPGDSGYSSMQTSREASQRGSPMSITNVPAVSGSELESHDLSVMWGGKRD